MMTETEEITLSIEVGTSEGQRTIPLQLKPLARCIGCFEITIETARLVKDSIEPILLALMKEAQGRTEYQVEKHVNWQLREATFGSIEEEFYRQVASELQKLRVSSPATGGAPPSDEEMAMLIEIFLNYPGMDSVCLLALAGAAAQKSLALDLDKAGLPEGVRVAARDALMPVFASAIVHHVKGGTSVRGMIKDGRTAKKKADDLLGKLRGA